jgi:hypothetical protein
MKKINEELSRNVITIDVRGKVPHIENILLEKYGVSILRKWLPGGRAGRRINANF